MEWREAVLARGVLLEHVLTQVGDPGGLGRRVVRPVGRCEEQARGDRLVQPHRVAVRPDADPGAVAVHLPVADHVVPRLRGAGVKHLFSRVLGRPEAEVLGPLADHPQRRLVVVLLAGEVVHARVPLERLPCALGFGHLEERRLGRRVPLLKRAAAHGRVRVATQLAHGHVLADARAHVVDQAQRAVRHARPAVAMPATVVDADRCMPDDKPEHGAQHEEEGEALLAPRAAGLRGRVLQRDVAFFFHI